MKLKEVEIIWVDRIEEANGHIQIGDKIYHFKIKVK